MIFGFIIVVIRLPLFDLDKHLIVVDSGDYLSEKTYVTFRETKKPTPDSQKEIEEPVVEIPLEVTSDLTENFEKDKSVKQYSSIAKSNSLLEKEGESSISQNNVFLTEASLGNREPPVYPLRALLQNIEGYVVVEFTIKSDGSVGEIIIIESVPKNIFDRSVIKAVKKFRYSPKIVQGKAIAVSGIRNRFEFKFD